MTADVVAGTLYLTDFLFFHILRGLRLSDDVLAHDAAKLVDQERERIEVGSRAAFVEHDEMAVVIDDERHAQRYGLWRDNRRLWRLYRVVDALGGSDGPEFADWPILRVYGPRNQQDCDCCEYSEKAQIDQCYDRFKDDADGDFVHGFSFRYIAIFLPI